MIISFSVFWEKSFLHSLVVFNQISQDNSDFGIWWDRGHLKWRVFCFVFWAMISLEMFRWSWFSKPLATICYLLPLEVSVLSQQIPSTTGDLKLKFSTASFSYTLLFWILPSHPLRESLLKISFARSDFFLKMHLSPESARWKLKYVGNFHCSWNEQIHNYN